MSTLNKSDRNQFAESVLIGHDFRPSLARIVSMSPFDVSKNKASWASFFFTSYSADGDCDNIADWVASAENEFTDSLYLDDHHLIRFGIREKRTSYIHPTNIEVGFCTTQRATKQETHLIASLLRQSVSFKLSRVCFLKTTFIQCRTWKIWSCLGLL